MKLLRAHGRTVFSVALIGLMVALALYAWGQSNVSRDAPYPVEPTAPRPTVRPSASAYQIFLPFVGKYAFSTLPSPKKGLTSPWGCKDIQALRASWSYNWTSNASGYDCPANGAVGVPMVWGRTQITETLRGTSEYALMFNEPDLGGQANISAGDAVTLAHDIFIAHPERKWIAPAPSHLHPEWLVEWREGYIAQYGESPPIAGIAVHCYLWTAQACIAYTQSQVDLAVSWDVEVWVTEFNFFTSYTRTLNDTLAEFRRYLDYLENEPRITHYAQYTTRMIGDPDYDSMTFEVLSPLLTWIRGDFTPYGAIYAGY